MVLSDSILLQISQKETSYNDLLTKMLASYSSIASAKAALSRVLKNLIAFGEIQKKDGYYFLTKKGKQTIESKLKNKILININNLLEKSIRANSLEHVDDIVKNIHTFLERGKSDSSLLKIGKTGATFYISDLESLKKELDNSIFHYTHLSSVLSTQINDLQKQNFEDYIIINLNKSVFDIIKDLVFFYGIEYLDIECSKEYIETINLFDNADFLIKKSEYIFKLNISDIKNFENLLLSNFEIAIQVRFKLYINEILVRFSFGKVYFLGPYDLITKIKKKRKGGNL
jgi:hypothetical protein